jgi:hypothetical protein
MVRWLVGTALPALVSYGDREELTMTALGAGTALSSLHAFGRAVLLLHGHKHVPTARLLAGMTDGCGDVLIASAGSAGTRERIHASRHPDAVRLWPSFNLVFLSEQDVQVESLSFPPRKTVRMPLRRLLARAGLETPPKPSAERDRHVDDAERARREPRQHQRVARRLERDVGRGEQQQGDERRNKRPPLAATYVHEPRRPCHFRRPPPSRAPFLRVVARASEPC